MSRIGKNPVAVPSGVTVNVSGQQVSAKGKLGELSVVLVDEVLAELADGKLVVDWDRTRLTLSDEHGATLAKTVNTSAFRTPCSVRPW